MFNTIEHMWIGADYWPTEENWKWRNSYIDFDGNIYKFKLNATVNNRSDSLKILLHTSDSGTINIVTSIM